MSDSIDSYISEVVDIAGERRGSKSGSLVMLLGDQNKQAFYKLVKADFEKNLLMLELVMKLLQMILIKL